MVRGLLFSGLLSVGLLAGCRQGSGSNGTASVASTGTSVVTSKATGVAPVTSAPVVTTRPAPPPSTSAGSFVFAACPAADSIAVAARDPRTGSLAAFTPVGAGSGTAPSALALSGSCLYAVCADGLAAFSISGGTLAPIGASHVSAGLDKPSAIAVAPNGKLAVVTNTGNDTVAAFTIDASGAPTLASTAALPASADAQGVIVDPQSKFVYVADTGTNEVSFLTLSPAGRLAAVGLPVSSGGTGPRAMAFHPTGKFLYVTNVTNAMMGMFSVDPTTGGFTSVGTVTTEQEPNSVVVHPSGKFIYLCGGTKGVVWGWGLDQTTGLIQVLSTTAAGVEVTLAAGARPASVALDPTGSFLYVADSGTGDVGVVTIDSSTGLLTLGTSTALTAAPSAAVVR